MEEKYSRCQPGVKIRLVLIIWIRRVQADYPLDRIEHITLGSSGLPVLFLHGWGGTTQSLSNLFEPISVHRKTISIALPGFGNSPEPPDWWGTREYADVIHRWISAQSLSKIDIIGHSFGGRVVMSLALNYSECVNRMILIDSAGLVIPRGPKVLLRLMTARTINWVGKLMGGELSEWLQMQKSKLGSADWAAASPVMRRILSRIIREDLSTDLAEIHSKTLLIWGSKDLDVPVKLGHRMNEIFPDSSLIILPGAGHHPFHDEPGKTLAEIWKWLELPAPW